MPSETIADVILATLLSSRVSGDDQGYFGKGSTSRHARYATFSSAKGQWPPQRGKIYTPLLCVVCLANPYPAPKGGFDADVVAVSQWQAAMNVSEADNDALVLIDEQQVHRRCLCRFQKRNLWTHRLGRARKRWADAQDGRVHGMGKRTAPSARTCPEADAKITAG